MRRLHRANGRGRKTPNPTVNNTLANQRRASAAIGNIVFSNVNRSKRIKRALDLCGGVTAGVALSPVIAATALVVRSRIGSPILFKQRRTGLAGEEFVMVKFRTMTNAKDSEGNLLPDEMRLTRIGKILRATSLDELPELINVLSGSMSLVGPRPLIPDYMGLYSKEQSRRHQVRPGITGLAQVRGRNRLGWAERLALDVWYVDNWSITLDLQILIATVFTVLAKKGISAEGHTSMPRFKGEE